MSCVRLRQSPLGASVGGVGLPGEGTLDCARTAYVYTTSTTTNPPSFWLIFREGDAVRIEPKGNKREWTKTTVLGAVSTIICTSTGKTLLRNRQALQKVCRNQDRQGRQGASHGRPKDPGAIPDEPTEQGECNYTEDRDKKTQDCTPTILDEKLCHTGCS